MKLAALLLLTAALPGPALAQHSAHADPSPASDPHARHAMPASKPGAAPTPVSAPVDPHAGHSMPAAPTSASDPHAGHVMPPVPAPASDPHAGHVMPAAPPPASDPHAGHVMPAAPPPASDPHAGHVMPAVPAPASDPHAGHVMPAVSAPASDPHAGHTMGEIDRFGELPLEPPPPAALRGPAHAADTAWDPRAMAVAREQLRREHGALTVTKIMLDRAEVLIRDGRDGYAIDGDAWHGGDIDKAWLKAEVEGAFGARPEHAELQALWSHAISPWFDLQAGVRYDIRPNPERAHLVFGVMGLAPYWFEIDAAAFVSHEGDLTARLEAEYDQRLTRRLFLQPRVELDLAAQDVPEIGIGAGLSSGEAGLRLRYEIVPEFAPYIGIAYERAFGQTADLRRREGERVGGWSLLAGVRAWF